MCLCLCRARECFPVALAAALHIPHSRPSKNLTSYMPPLETRVKTRISPLKLVLFQMHQPFPQKHIAAPRRQCEPTTHVLRVPASHPGPRYNSTGPGYPGSALSSNGERAEVRWRDAFLAILSCHLTQLMVQTQVPGSYFREHSLVAGSRHQGRSNANRPRCPSHGPGLPCELTMRGATHEEGFRPLCVVCRLPDMLVCA